MSRALALAVVAALAGCGGNDNGGGFPPPTTGSGGSGGTTTPPPPSNHVFVTAAPQQLAAGHTGFTPNIPAPANATITYQIQDTTPTITSDTFDAIVGRSVDTNAYAGAGTISGYAERTAFVNVSATTPGLPAGTYVVLIYCRNIADDCIFNLSVSAFY